MDSKPLAHVDDILEGRSLVVDDIALFKIDGEIWAISNICPHEGGPLGEGETRDSIVVCPWHAWEFDVKTGESLTSPGTYVETYPLKIVDGFIYLDKEEC